MKRNAFKITGIILGLCLALYFLTKLLTPTWYAENTDNTVKGIYREPKNSIQVLFLGTSQIVYGISPISLYNNYGISAYNMGIPEQPYLSSYYWLKEVQKLHPDTLKTVVLNTSSLFIHNDSFEVNRKSLTYMKLSSIKLEAMKACAERYENIRLQDYLLSLISFHNRWSQISEDDFTGMTDKANYFFTRGQNVDFTMSYNKYKAENLLIPQYNITEESNFSPEVYEETWDPYNKGMLDRIYEFCVQHGLNLVLVGIPKNTSDKQHDTVQYLADQYGIPFIDFNLTSIQEEIGFNYGYDYVENRHPNYYGAEKITDYIGAFLKEHYALEDVRGNQKYVHLPQQSQDYEIAVQDAKLQLCDDLDEYLQILRDKRFTVYLSVSGDGVSGLQESDKNTLFELGFKGTADLAPGHSYIGIKSSGKTLVDRGAQNEKEIIIVQGELARKNELTINGVYTRIQDGGGYSMLTGENIVSLMSAGDKAGSYAYININEEGLSENKTGLNFVVYDNYLDQYVDSSNFDTSTPDRRRTDLELPGVYLSRLDGAKLQTARSPEEYISFCYTDNQCTAFLVGTAAEPTELLSSEAIDELKTCGLQNIEDINQKHYAAIIRNGNILAEESSESDGSITILGEDPVIYLISLETDEKTILIDKERRELEDDSIHLIVWSEKGSMVIAEKKIR